MASNAQMTQHSGFSLVATRQRPSHGRWTALFASRDAKSAKMER